MPRSRSARRPNLLAWLCCALPAALIGASCSDHRGKLDPQQVAGTSAGGTAELVSAGEHAGGAGGSIAQDTDLPAIGGAGGAGGAAAEPVAGGGAAPLPTDCIYRLDVEADASGAGGAAGSGGAAGNGSSDEGSQSGQGGQGGEATAPTIAKATSRVLGEYLTDASGRALYVFGADLAGDCEAPPLSACEGDCLLSWPIFHAAPRVLAEGIEDAAFGSIVRADGLLQTTYYGWPLYYYANDAEPGDVTGHGSGVWGLAELVLPNVVVRRVGMDRLLADGAGRTLYAFAEDMLGTPSSAPVSACVGACLDTHPPFAPRYVGAISTLEPRDFSSFVRGDGTTQVAYKGAPLYYSLLDGRPGAVNGAEDEGFTIVIK